jgi:hypothetical protein
MSEERANRTIREKKIDKNKFNGRKKLSVVFDRPMSNVYEKKYFPDTSLCCGRNPRKHCQHSNNGFYFKIITFEEYIY